MRGLGGDEVRTGEERRLKGEREEEYKKRTSVLEEWTRGEEERSEGEEGRGEGKVEMSDKD